jgi:hypothetical protein
MNRKTSPAPIDLYRDVWQLTLDNIYDQDSLGDWDRWLHRFDGGFATVNDAVAACYKMLASTGDHYNTLITPGQLEHEYVEEMTAPPTVTAWVLPDGHGYLKVRTFSDHKTAERMAEGMNLLGHAHSLIVDLRGNPGGYIEQASLATSLFLNTGDSMVHKTRLPGRGYSTRFHRVLRDSIEIRNRLGHSSQYKHEYSERLPNLAAGRPVVVLVDSVTCSAAEVFPAILLDNNRIHLIGAGTRGKGISQGRFDTYFGCTVRITCGRFFPPSGHFFGDDGQRVSNGIVPGTYVPDFDGGDDWHVIEAVRYLDRIMAA